jgi:hypothetical protein
LRLFIDIFREVKAFDYKCDVFLKFKRLLEDIIKKSEAFSKMTRLFENIFNGIEAFLSDVRFFILFPGFFSLICDGLKNFEDF